MDAHGWSLMIMTRKRFPVPGVGASRRGQRQVIEFKRSSKKG